MFKFYVYEHLFQGVYVTGMAQERWQNVVQQQKQRSRQRKSKEQEVGRHNSNNVSQTMVKKNSKVTWTVSLLTSGEKLVFVFGFFLSEYWTVECEMFTEHF